MPVRRRSADSPANRQIAVQLSDPIAAVRRSQQFNRFLPAAHRRTRQSVRDLSHHAYVPASRPQPNDCSLDPEGACPEVKASTAKARNLEGSIGVRLLIQESILPASHIVPFYFQPTLGGADIGGNNSLGSYEDYRFRAPNAILFRVNFEHSLWGPFGAMFLLDEGKVALHRSDIDFSHLRHSYSAGLTLRAGGFPVIQLLFSWGGSEDTHIIGGVNNSLLGGNLRPSLY